MVKKILDHRVDDVYRSCFDKSLRNNIGKFERSVSERLPFNNLLIIITLITVDNYYSQIQGRLSQTISHSDVACEK